MTDAIVAPLGNEGYYAYKLSDESYRRQLARCRRLKEIRDSHSPAATAFQIAVRDGSHHAKPLPSEEERMALKAKIRQIWEKWFGKEIRDIVETTGRLENDRIA